MFPELNCVLLERFHPIRTTFHSVKNKFRGDLPENTITNYMSRKDSSVFETMCTDAQAVLLRNSLTSKTVEAYREVYCWKTVNCLELWGRVLAAHAGQPELRPLVYPVTQLLLGAAKLVPSPRWFAIRLRLARILNALSAATGLYVPLAPLLLEVLSWNELSKGTKGSGQCPDLLLQLRLSKQNLKQPAVQEELVTQVCVQCCRLRRNIAYVNPKIIYFHYRKICFRDQSIQKINNLILKKTSLSVSHASCFRNSVSRTLLPYRVVPVVSCYRNSLLRFLSAYTEGDSKE